MRDMHSTTLRGVFPEPKPVHKKNFIKENMRQIKQMQGLLQNAEDVTTKLMKDDKYRNVPPKVSSQFSAPVTKSKHKISQQSVESGATSSGKQNILVKSKFKQVKPHLEIKQLRDFGEIDRKDQSNFYDNDKITHRGIQTERSDDLSKLYECGVIKYPSAFVVEEINSAKKKVTNKNQDRGDSDSLTKKSNSLSEKVQNLNLEEKPDFIKQNIQALKAKTNRPDNHTNTNLIPPSYQKGVLPKYLKERKEEQQKEVDPDPECPDGHVLLPEEERKETLRVLRQSYADRIQELNAMPVRNDTLRMRKRKIELEEELKKIDEGIKVFQRPKVFVKINA